MTPQMWKLVEQLATLICEQPESRDGYELERIQDELADAVRTMRRDRSRFGRELRALAERMSRDEWSMKAAAAPRLRVVDEGGIQ